MPYPCSGISGILVFLRKRSMPPRRVDQFLLAGEKRMTGGTDFHGDIVLRGSGLDQVAARAADLGLLVLRMNVGFH